MSETMRLSDEVLCEIAAKGAYRSYATQAALARECLAFRKLKAAILAECESENSGAVSCCNIAELIADFDKEQG